jgi:prepilin-type N-terminal cleavage/methylation domain-containing protein
MNRIKFLQKIVTLSKQENGFSFIELIMAIVILSIALVSFLGVFSNSLANNTTQQFSIRAAGVAREKMESLLSDRYTHGFDAITEANYPVENLTSPYEGYNIRTTVNFVDETDLNTIVASSHYKKTMITISHNDGLFPPLFFFSIISNYGAEP